MPKKLLKIPVFSLLNSVLILLLFAGIFLQLLATRTQASQGVEPATVIKIIDGDTLDVTMSKCPRPLNGKPQQCRVQLACIDAPEVKDKPFFQEAKTRLQTLLPPGKQIMVRDTGTKARDRIVAEVFVESQSVNLQMVREGKAIILCKSLNGCAETRNSYLNAEAAAKQEGLGVWNLQQPWMKLKNQRPCSG